MLSHANEASELEVLNGLADAPATALAWAIQQKDSNPLAKARALARSGPSNRERAADNGPERIPAA